LISVEGSRQQGKRAAGQKGSRQKGTTTIRPFLLAASSLLPYINRKAN
jgi:hypothetical protein